MRAKVLAIPREEVETHFAQNSRQDLKVVVPEILSDDLFRILKAKGKDLKPESPVHGITWRHSTPNDPNLVCESSEFMDIQLPQYARGPFAISFANEEATQDEHYHMQHLEIYVTDHAISAEFRSVDDNQCERITLASGGILVFAPNVVHKVRLAGLTVIIELPALAQDKIDANLVSRNPITFVY
jgi:hypothetical protein